MGRENSAVLADEKKEEEPFAPPWDRRGADMSRILGLSDGVFGFAMTLLILNITLQTASALSAQPGCATTPPSFACEMVYLYPSFLTYALGFLIIAGYWRLHHLVFAYIVRWDQLLVQLNILFLALVALQPFLVTVIRTYVGLPEGLDVEIRQAVLFYAALALGTGVVLFAIWYHAVRAQLIPKQLDALGVLYIDRSLAFTPAVFAISMVVAIPYPRFAAYLWIGIVVTTSLTAHRSRKPPPALTPEMIAELQRRGLSPPKRDEQ
jgi:uncharacterized membrane protein